MVMLPYAIGLGSTVQIYELAQLNIAIMRDPLESPVMIDFVANLDASTPLQRAASALFGVFRQKRVTQLRSVHLAT